MRTCCNQADAPEAQVELLLQQLRSVRLLRLLQSLVQQGGRLLLVHAQPFSSGWPLTWQRLPPM